MALVTQFPKSVPCVLLAVAGPPWCACQLALTKLAAICDLPREEAHVARTGQPLTHGPRNRALSPTFCRELNLPVGTEEVADDPAPVTPWDDCSPPQYCNLSRNQNAAPS